MTVAEARVAVLVGSKGRGSNLRALVSATQEPGFPAKVVVVISPIEESAAVEFARKAEIDVVVAPPKADSYTNHLHSVLKDFRVDYLCLAGLMTKLPSSIVDEFSNRILNVHPALLPKHGGKGMYGQHVHQAVLDAKEAESGCTVHLVTHEYDEGPILLQMTCPVSPDDTVESLSAKVLELEHKAFPLALKMLVEGHVGVG